MSLFSADPDFSYVGHLDGLDGKGVQVNKQSTSKWIAWDWLDGDMQIPLSWGDEGEPSGCLSWLIWHLEVEVDKTCTTKDNKGSYYLLLG